MVSSETVNGSRSVLPAIVAKRDQGSCASGGRRPTDQRRFNTSKMKPETLFRLHEETCKKTLDIMRAKNSDYCGGTETVDALANFKSAKSLGLHPVTGLLLRMQDKLMRIKSFVNDGQLQVAGESVDDACEDLVNYSILAKALLTEEREEHCETCDGPVEDDCDNMYCPEYTPNRTKTTLF